MDHRDRDTLPVAQTRKPQIRPLRTEASKPPPLASPPRFPLDPARSRPESHMPESHHDDHRQPDSEARPHRAESAVGQPSGDIGAILSSIRDGFATMSDVLQRQSQALQRQSDALQRQSDALQRQSVASDRNFERLFAEMKRSQLASELSDVRVKDYYNPAAFAVIRFRPTFSAFLVSACAHLSAALPARLFWFDQFKSGAQELTAHNYDSIMQAGKVFEVFLSASTPPSSPTLTTKSRRSTESGGSVGCIGQADFREALLYRDGSRCVLCGADPGPANLRMLEAAHVVPFETPSSTFRSYGLATIHDVRNGVLLCKLCHDDFDRSLWYVRPDGVVVVADALLLDPIRGPRWRSFASQHKLSRPLDAAKNSWWPSPETWVFREEDFVKRQQKRWAASKDKAYCAICGGYVKASNLLSHQAHKTCSGAAAKGLIDVEATPPQRRQSRGGGTSGAWGMSLPVGGAMSRAVPVEAQSHLQPLPHELASTVALTPPRLGAAVFRRRASSSGATSGRAHAGARRAAPTTAGRSSAYADAPSSAEFIYQGRARISLIDSARRQATLASTSVGHGARAASPSLSVTGQTDARTDDRGSPFRTPAGPTPQVPIGRPLPPASLDPCNALLYAASACRVKLPPYK